MKTKPKINTIMLFAKSIIDYFLYFRSNNNYHYGKAID